MTHISRLDHRCRIRVSGPDTVNFLNGLLTLNSETVAATPELAHYGAFLRPQGKLFADLVALALSPEAITLDVHLDLADEVLAKLKLYRLRAKVEIERLDEPVFVAFGGPLPAGFVKDGRSAIIGADFGFSYDQEMSDASHADWLHWRIRHGLSDPGFDFPKDELYAIEANLDLLSAIDFKKGCYIGQELTSRMKRRGPVKNRILPFTFDHQPLAGGAEVLNAGMRTGRVIIADEGQGLALMRLDRMAGDLSVESGPLAFSIPDWIAPHIVSELS